MLRSTHFQYYNRFRSPALLIVFAIKFSTGTSWLFRLLFVYSCLYGIVLSRQTPCINYDLALDLSLSSSWLERIYIRHKECYYFVLGFDISWENFTREKERLPACIQQVVGHALQALNIPRVFSAYSIWVGYTRRPQRITLITMVNMQFLYSM